MSQYDFGNIDETTTSGPQLGALLESWRTALNGSHKGASAPSYATAGMIWVDDSSDPEWLVRFYDGSNWLTLFNVNTSNNSVVMPGSASKLGDVTASQFLRNDQNAFMPAYLEARYGTHGGYGTDGNGGASSNWACNIWTMGVPYNGTGYGTSFLTDTTHYGMVWTREGHPSVRTEAGEGVYIYRSGDLVAALGYSGSVFRSKMQIAGTSPMLELKDTDGTLGGTMHGRVRIYDKNGNVQASIGTASSAGHTHFSNYDGNQYFQAKQVSGTANIYLQTANNNGSYVTVADFNSGISKINGYPVGLISTTGSNTQTTLPVGAHIAVQTQGTHYMRNATLPVRLDTGDSGHYTNTGSGSLVSGTWKACGQCTLSNNGGVLARRVA